MARITKSVPERRQEIVDAARVLFMENGFDKTQVSDISAKIHVSQGLVYHYFKSKTEMLYAVIDELADERHSAMNDMLESINGKTIDKLKAIFEQNPEEDRYDELMRSIHNDPALTECFRNKINAAATPLLTQLIDKGNADGSWHCEFPRETAIFIMHGFNGLFEQGYVDFDANKKTAFTSIVFRILGSSQR